MGDKMVVVQILVDKEKMYEGEFEISSILPQAETCILLLSAIADILYKDIKKGGEGNDKGV